MKKAMIISCFGWYERRLYYLYKRFEDERFEVKMLASDYNHITKESIREKNEKIQYLSVTRYKKNISFSRFYSHWGFGVHCYRIMKTWKPDIVYVLAPPNLCVYFSSIYKSNNTNTKLIVDIIDLWPESFPSLALRKTPIYPLWKKMRSKGLDLADGIVTECDYYSQELDCKYKKKIYPLRLFKELGEDEREEIRSAVYSYSSSMDKGIIKLCYLGSINNIIDLKSIREILYELNNYYDVIVYIIGAGNSKADFIELLNKVGCQIQDYGVVFDENIKRHILTQCDYGLNLMINSVKVGLTIKSIDYLAYGLPIINNIKGDTWHLVSKNDIGVNYLGNSQELIANIRSNDVIGRKKRAWDCFNSYFSKPGFESRYESILEELLVFE